jgi:DNA-directed RNA polymerase subunit M/transcription elongation factor TFIIS
MSAVSTFFRHCPSCGRRFEIRLVAKKEVDDETEVTKTKGYAGTPGTRGRKDSNLLLEGERPAIVEVPRIEEVKEFRYYYKCKHCGHEWSEERFRMTEKPGNPDYRGD